MGKEGEDNLFDGIDLSGLSHDGPDTGKEVTLDETVFQQEAPSASVEETPEPAGSEAKKDKESEGDEGDIVPEGADTLKIDPSLFEVENTTTNTSISETSVDNSSSPLQLLATTLQAEGLIDLEEDQTVEDAKDLISAFNAKLEEKKFEDLNDEQALYLESLANGIPEEDIKKTFSNQRALNNVTAEQIEATENVGLRMTLISQDLIAKGLAKEKAEKLAKQQVELGEDVEAANDALASLKEIESQRLKSENERIAKEKADAIKESETKLSDLKDTILKTEEFIPGLKPNSVTKKKVFENMTKIVDYDENRNPINAITKAKNEDPDKFDTMVSYIYTITEGFSDFSKLKNSAKSTAIEELNKKLKGNQVGGGKAKEIQSTTSKGLFETINKKF
jgi:hypothetical protein